MAAMDPGRGDIMKHVLSRPSFGFWNQTQGFEAVLFASSMYSTPVLWKLGPRLVGLSRGHVDVDR